MSAKSYELLIFDWDGTLMDSTAHIVACMKFAAAELGLELAADQAIRNTIGLGLAEAVRQLLPQASDALVQAMVNEYRQQVLVHHRNLSPLFEGTREALQALKDQGYYLAIATGKSRRGLDLDLETTGIGEFFPITRCADETFSKPHPRMLEEILVDFNLEAGQSLMIGDSTYDLQMALNIRMDALAVTSGAHGLEQLLSYQPRGHIETVAQLPVWLQQQEVK